jgi:hypothetical protein
MYGTSWPHLSDNAEPKAHACVSLFLSHFPSRYFFSSQCVLWAVFRCTLKVEIFSLNLHDINIWIYA